MNSWWGRSGETRCIKCSQNQGHVHMFICLDWEIMGTNNPTFVVTSLGTQVCSMKLFSWPDSGSKLIPSAFSHNGISLTGTSLLASYSVLLGFKLLWLSFKVSSGSLLGAHILDIMKRILGMIKLDDYYPFLVFQAGSHSDRQGIWKYKETLCVTWEDVEGIGSTPPQSSQLETGIQAEGRKRISWITVRMGSVMWKMMDSMI